MCESACADGLYTIVLNLIVHSIPYFPIKKTESRKGSLTKQDGDGNKNVT